MSACPEQRPASPRIGDTIDGRYRIDAVYATGGMSTVFRATHLLLARPVAMKVVSDAVLGFPGVAARFLREARAATQLKNDHIVQVFDVGVLESGVPYMIMEWLEGSDLAQVMQRGPPGPVKEAVEYILQTCEALAEVHGMGIVHRDLKPSNLFLTTGPDGSPRVKLLDFGVSKVRVGRGGAHITAAGAVLGSPTYMAPEQMGEADAADERTDVWGLGVVLFELLTGHVPYNGECLTDILTAILMRPIPMASEDRPDVPLALDDVIARCLAAAADDRFANVAALAEEIAPFGAEGSRERAAAVGRIMRAAQRQPMESTAAASDADLMDHLQQASVRPGGTPITPRWHVEVKPSSLASTIATTSTPLPAKRRWVGGIAALAVAVAVGAGLPRALAALSPDADADPLRASGPAAPPPRFAPPPSSSSAQAMNDLLAIEVQKRPSPASTMMTGITLPEPGGSLPDSIAAEPPPIATTTKLAPRNIHDRWRANGAHAQGAPIAASARRGDDLFHERK